MSVALPFLLDKHASSTGGTPWCRNRGRGIAWLPSSSPCVCRNGHTTPDLLELLNSFLLTFRKHLWLLLLAGQLATILNIIVCDHGGDLSCRPRRVVGYASRSRISYRIR